MASFFRTGVWGCCHFLPDAAREHDVKRAVVAQPLEAADQRIVFGASTIKRVGIERDVAAAWIDRAAVGEGNTGVHWIGPGR